MKRPTKQQKDDKRSIVGKPQNNNNPMSSTRVVEKGKVDDASNGKKTV